MEISREFSKYYPLSIDEDECGFITLYYLNYLENTKNKKSIKVILVCNSGVGATKLLSTKIKNNFPAIEIVKTSSYFDLQSGRSEFIQIHGVFPDDPSVAQLGGRQGFQRDDQTYQRSCRETDCGSRCAP